MSCRCDAHYDRLEDCPRCSGELPDGPDELLSEMAENERSWYARRPSLESPNGARRCRICDGAIAPGPTAGVHAECLPEALPEGARSCGGCAELLLGDEDEFDHDLCSTPADCRDELAEGPNTQPLLDLIAAFPVDEEDVPTEPMLVVPELVDSVVRVQDAVRCICQRWCPVEIVTRSAATRPNVVNALTITCTCGVRIGILFSWSRRCITTIRHYPPDSVLN